MSIIKLGNLDDIQEAKLCPEGAYYLGVSKADTQEKDGRHSIRLILTIEDISEDYANLFHYMGLPGEGDDEEMVRMKQLFLKRTLFWLDMHDQIADGTLELTDFLGARSSVQIPVASDMYEGRETRNIKWPNLPTEEKAAVA